MSNTETDTPAKRKKAFYKKPLGCLGILFLTLVVLLLVGVWAAGRLAPTIAASVVKGKSGATLTVAENNTSLLSGRVDLKGVKLSNPEGFSEQRFLELNQLKAEIKLSSLSGDTYEIPEVILDIKEFVFVGRGKSVTQYSTDNNLTAFRDAFAGEDTKEKEKKADDGKPTQFHIGKLIIRLDRLYAIVGDNAGSPTELVDTRNVLNLEFTDVTHDNINSKVFNQIDQIIRSKGLSIAVFGSLNILSSEAINLVNQAGDQAGKAVNQAGKVVNQAGQKATDVIKGASDTLGGLLGGKKKDEEKDEENK